MNKTKAKKKLNKRKVITNIGIIEELVPGEKISIPPQIKTNKSRTLKDVNQSILELIAMSAKIDAIFVSDTVSLNKICKDYRNSISKLVKELFPTIQLLVSAHLIQIASTCSYKVDDMEIVEVCENGGFQLNTQKFVSSCVQREKPKKKRAKK